jgi:hypothetical protein
MAVDGRLCAPQEGGRDNVALLFTLLLQRWGPGAGAGFAPYP